MDGDTRTEDAMQDLRSLRDAFRQLNVIAPDLNKAMIDEIQERAEELFAQCVSSLEKSLQLWKTSDSLAGRTLGPETDSRAAGKTGQRSGGDCGAYEPDAGGSAAASPVSRRATPGCSSCAANSIRASKVAKKVEQRVDSMLTGGSLQNLTQINKS